MYHVADASDTDAYGAITISCCRRSNDVTRSRRRLACVTRLSHLSVRPSPSAVRTDYVRPQLRPTCVRRDKLAPPHQSVLERAASYIMRQTRETKRTRTMVICDARRSAASECVKLSTVCNRTPDSH